MTNTRWLSREEALDMYPMPVLDSIKPFEADDGKEYYVVHMSSHAYRYLKPDYWQDALDQSKRQLGKLRYRARHDSNVIQFVPKANPNRELPLCNAPDVPLCREIAGKVREGWADTSPSEYSAPDGDCA